VTAYCLLIRFRPEGRLFLYAARPRRSYIALASAAEQLTTSKIVGMHASVCAMPKSCTGKGEIGAHSFTAFAQQALGVHAGEMSVQNRELLYLVRPLLAEPGLQHLGAMLHHR